MTEKIRKRRIAVVCCSSSWGGMEMLAVKQAVKLIKRGHSVTFIGQRDTLPIHEAVNSGIPVIPVKVKGYYDIKALVEFYNVLKQYRFDVVHAHYSKDLWTIVPAMYLLKSRSALVLTKHIGTQKPKRDILHKFIYNRVDKIIAISKIIEKNIINTHPVKKNKVIAIPNGIDTNLFYSGKSPEIRKKYNISDKSFVIGIAGRLSWWKGYREFLLMAESLLNKNLDVRFIAVGGPTIGEEREAEEIKTFCSSLGICNRVVFTGFQKDVASFYRAMDLFVYPAYAEAFGLVLIEAMATGLAVIASDSDGIPEIVKNGETGILVPVRGSQKLTEAVLSLLQDSGKITKFKERARKRVEKYFSEEKMILAIESLYKKIIIERNRL